MGRLRGERSTLPPPVLSRLSRRLPGGEEGPLAVEGLREGVAQGDHAAVAPRAAALHHHAGHLHQLDGAPAVLQRLAQVQHLGRGPERRRQDQGQDPGRRC